MIRLLDRYVTAIFAAALVVFTAAFIALFITVDFSLNLVKFLQLKEVAKIPFILKYYAIRIPLSLGVLLPIVVLFASIFTVIKLARTNEILPVAASGTSLRRMSLPFLAAGVLAAIGMATLEEFVLPSLAPELARTGEILSSREVSYGVADYVESGWIWGENYDHVHQEMRGKVHATLLDPNRHPLVTVIAAHCRWDPARRKWVAFGGEVTHEQEIVKAPVGLWGKVQSFLLGNAILGRPQPRIEPIPPEGFVLEAPFKVETLRTSASSGDRYVYAPFRELLKEAQARPDVPVWAMRLHARFAFPLSAIVLLLVGLPSVVAAHSKSFVRGMVTSSIFAGIYIPAYLVGTYLGSHGTIPPALGAWFATASFGMLGLVSFARMRT